MKAIIDGDSLIYLSLPKKSLENSTYEDCVLELNNRIAQLLNVVGATEYVICLTVGRCFRYKNWKYNLPYKHKRKNTSRPPIFYALEEYLKQNYNVRFVPGLEADDLVCTFYNEFKKLNEECVICSTDKDVLKQVPGKHYDYNKREFINVTTKEAYKFLYTQMITGDATDNIEGIYGIGEKSANLLFKNKKHFINVVINEYYKRYSLYEAINRFYETFNMVYILKSFEEVQKETGIILELPILEKIEWSERTETGIW